MTGLADLVRRAAAPELTLIGLLSGTSADGVDAAVVCVRGSGADLAARTLATVTRPYPDALRERVLAARDAGAEEIARLDAELGDRFAEAAIAAREAAGLTSAEIDAIASHGQTIAHVPGGGVVGPHGRRGAATLQIGSAARIAECTGHSVISDFRSRDAAAGGEAAPLVPYVDWLLLRPETGVRLALNLGGVANVTLVPPRSEDVLAFDTGPANGPLDAAAALVSGGRLRRDEGGEAAGRGVVDDEEVVRLLAHPFFPTLPPRSLSRDTFGEEFAAAFVGRREDLSGDDVLATLTEFVARSVVRACARHLPVDSAQDVVVSGGGLHNAHLIARLSALFHPLPVRSSAELGVDPDGKEAVAFAVLGAASLRGHASSLPHVTGASGPRVLGSITPA